MAVKKGAKKEHLDKFKVVVSRDGPYLVSGVVPLTEQTIEADESGCSSEWHETKKYPQQDGYALCRCGKSKNKPFCDGTHAKIKFDGAETASREPYLKQANKIDGPSLKLTDAQDLCSFARFCDRGGGVWNHVRVSNDPETKKMAVEEACNCPSGRLVAWNNETREPIEPELRPSIGLIEDPQMGVMGPIWVRGGISIESAEGKTYEKRNRVTLCRCGKSDNKPFCDGSHAN